MIYRILRCSGLIDWSSFIQRSFLNDFSVTWYFTKMEIFRRKKRKLKSKLFLTPLCSAVTKLLAPLLGQLKLGSGLYLSNRLERWNKLEQGGARRNFHPLNRRKVRQIKSTGDAVKASGSIFSSEMAGSRPRNRKWPDRICPPPLECVPHGFGNLRFGVSRNRSKDSICIFLRRFNRPPWWSSRLILVTFHEIQPSLFVQWATKVMTPASMYYL